MKKEIKYQGISTLEVLQEAKNYNKWIADAVLEHTLAPALEIGAGTGNLSKYFLKLKKLYITDNDKGLVSYLKKKFSKESNTIVDIFDVTTSPNKKFLNYFSTVYGINVLEHIEDDEKALKNIHKILRKKGKVVLLVPAKKIAYSRLDHQLGHFRRYEKEELTEKLERNGFKVKKIYFFNIVGLFSWYVRDKVNRNNIALKSHHIALFDIIVPVLRKIESKIAVPVGISLIAVAEKVTKKT